MKEMKLLGATIKLESDYLDINELKFLKDNPRVYACTHGTQDFSTLPEEEQQELIYEKLLEEPSVKKLTREIKRHGGLIESILVRLDTKEVIEGNSRLAVYRKLHKDNHEGDWELIPCEMVSSLTNKQQFAFLSQIHVKGKTQWSAYEKANLVYVKSEAGWAVNEMVKLFGESEPTIRQRIKTIKLMKENNDNERQHFSYYDVIIRNKDIKKETDSKGALNNLLDSIRHFDNDESNNDFTAVDLRKKLPDILKKTKILKKFNSGEISLDEAYQRAETSDLQTKIKQAAGLLEDISKSKIEELEQSRFNSFKHSVRKLSREVKRVDSMIKSRDKTV